ncbi:mechanosensitive ion channel family protein [Halorussus halophilus]|uniref:mechanosensitive ion channel family protein n=1 Tax=Halorussus halophilus TaxID=2650975 RepID=UPI0013015D47|nr:mechanosensitive ion channel family protein [Halorussus halophilus]
MADVQPLPFLEFLGPEYSQIATQAIYFVVAFAGLYLLGRIAVMPLVRKFLYSREMDEHARKPLLKVTHILVGFAAVGVAFALAGFGNIVTSIATVAAAATLAIGFAMQDVLKNFVSGVFIYTDKPFRIGDWIEWNNGTYEGIVDDIGLRVTRVRTFDNELLTVPNSQLTESVIKNPVANQKLRLQFLFGISYDDDIGRARDIIVEEAENHPGIMDDPAPSVRLTELGDSFVGLKSRIWIADPSRSDYVKIRGTYVQNVKERFDAEDITIPFPNRTLSGAIEMSNVDGVVQATSDD